MTLTITGYFAGVVCAGFRLVSARQRAAVGGTRLALVSHHTHVAGMSETVLDVKGMNCPLPVLKANRVLRGMPAGARLRVLATDRAAVADFQAFCRETGHALLAWSEETGVFSFVIRRRADASEQKGSQP